MPRRTFFLTITIISLYLAFWELNLSICHPSEFLSIDDKDERLKNIHVRDEENAPDKSEVHRDHRNYIDEDDTIDNLRKEAKEVFRVSDRNEHSRASNRKYPKDTFLASKRSAKISQKTEDRGNEKINEIPNKISIRKVGGERVLETPQKEKSNSSSPWNGILEFFHHPHHEETTVTTKINDYSAILEQFNREKIKEMNKRRNITSSALRQEDAPVTNDWQRTSLKNETPDNKVHRIIFDLELEAYPIVENN